MSLPGWRRHRWWWRHARRLWPSLYTLLVVIVLHWLLWHHLMLVGVTTVVLLLSILRLLIPTWYLHAMIACQILFTLLLEESIIRALHHLIPLRVLLEVSLIHHHFVMLLINDRHVRWHLIAATILLTSFHASCNLTTRTALFFFFLISLHDLCYLVCVLFLPLSLTQC